MSSLIDKCPTPELILKYFNMDLDRGELEKIEVHFSNCDQCILEHGYYGNFIEQATLSSKVQKELWLNSNADTISVVAASSFDNTGISEIISKDEKYILKKIPFIEDEHTSLLVIELTDPCTQGKLYVHLLGDSELVLIGSELIDEDNTVCFEINSNIELKNLLITIV